MHGCVLEEIELIEARGCVLVRSACIDSGGGRGDDDSWVVELELAVVEMMAEL